MPKGKYERIKYCDHEWGRCPTSLNYVCKVCDGRLSWGFEQELEFLDSIIDNLHRTIEKKVEILEGYIQTLSGFSAANFTVFEDDELMKYAAKLLILLERE